MSGWVHLWHSKQGSFTTDNRDYCGIAKNNSSILYLLIDGISKSPNGGEFAKEFVHLFLDIFVGSDELQSENTLQSILKKVHETLRRKFPADSASYILALHNGDSMVTLHAGDCRLGTITNDGRINWLTPVHTLANAIIFLTDNELRLHPDRHTLTRSFKAKRFEPGIVNHFPLLASDSLILASDGFWAELDETEQIVFSNKGVVDKIGTFDDISSLLLTRVPESNTAVKTRIYFENRPCKNIYICSS